MLKLAREFFALRVVRGVIAPDNPADHQQLVDITVTLGDHLRALPSPQVQSLGLGRMLVMKWLWRMAVSE